MNLLSKTYVVMSGEKGLSALLKITTLKPKYSLIHLSAHLYPDGNYLLVFPCEEKVFPFEGDTLEIKTLCLSDDLAVVVDLKSCSALLWAKQAYPLKDKAERLAREFLAVETEKYPLDSPLTAVEKEKSPSVVVSTVVETEKKPSGDSLTVVEKEKYPSASPLTAVEKAESPSVVDSTVAETKKKPSGVSLTAVEKEESTSVVGSTVAETEKKPSGVSLTVVEKEEYPSASPLDGITEVCINPKREEVIFEGLGDRLDYLLENYPPCEKLNLAYPDSRWVEVKEEDCAYVVGVLYNESGVTTVCYGIEGEFSKKPMKEGYEWLPLDVNKWEEEGFWIIYQQIENLL